jgi:hypothetical protein
MARNALSAWVVAGALVALAAAPAFANHTAKPVPACQGLAAEDVTGDHAQPSSDAQDLKGVFFLTNAQNRTTANIQVANLTTDVPPPFVATSWWAMWQAADGSTQYVKASTDVLNPGLVVYTYGFQGAASLEEEGETAGHMWLGPDGVAQIQIPTSKAPLGSTLGVAQARTTVDLGVPGVLTALRSRDWAPGSAGIGAGAVRLEASASGGGNDYTAQQCPAV